ncbi:MAG: rhodanese-like domain-containing protein [Dehalococcoidia bacterium]|jgi:rhodanese-related sulfurtransferase|nr:MAG: Rhodanese-related sulfurtransferase [Chloroflexota bacterium]|tara:strand:- start:6826 stop:7158 length:333 start_codon:yes stop_codon:yes gene_type:complete
MNSSQDSSFKKIDVHEAKKMIEKGDVQIIDSREADEHTEGHVPDSINIPHMETFNRLSEIETNKPVLFICKSGQRSAVALEFAIAAGLTNDLYNVEGGHDAWTESGYELD